MKLVREGPEALEMSAVEADRQLRARERRLEMLDAVDVVVNVPLSLLGALVAGVAGLFAWLWRHRPKLR